MQLTNRHLLIFILLVATILRFYNYFEIPFTHDEFSALFRTHFNSFSDLIEYGVKTTDTHPPGVQVFLYYWTSLFGYSEWIVKLPFILSGIGAIYLIFCIGKEWYNETVGLITAAFLASIQYTIMYSQIARPYTSGLLFSLLMVYYWTLIMRKPESQFNRNLILFIFSSTLCAYNHHFSLLFAAIVGISGIFFIIKKHVIKYLLSGVAIFILYSPNLPIFFHQLNMGGIEEWLSKPQNDFIFNYLAYCFNYSFLVYLVVLGCLVFGLMNARKQLFRYKKQTILFFCWFITPFLIGFFYSKYVNSVIQFSVLIFSFPFLLFVLFGFITPQKTTINLLLITIILSINIFSLIHDRKHYTLAYQSAYRELIIDHGKTQQQHKSIFSVIDSNREIAPYYHKQLGIDTNYTWFDTFTSLQDFSRFLKEKSEQKSYFYFGSLSSNNPLSVPLIQQYFPTIEWQHNYAGATSYLFSNKTNNIVTKSFDELSFESENSPNWSPVDHNLIIDSLHFTGNKAYLMTPNQEYSFSFTKPLNYLITNENNFIDISLQAYLPQNYDEIILVTSLEKDIENIHWSGTPFNTFERIDSTSKWVKIFHTVKVSDIPIDDKMILKVYIWNKGKHTFAIDDFKIIIREGNPIIYSLLEKF